MGTVAFRVGFWLVAVLYWLVAHLAGSGWALRRLVRATGRSSRPAAAGTGPAPTKAPTGAYAGPDAAPRTADPGSPVRAPQGPSMEGRLVAALLAGRLLPEHYHEAMHMLAAQDQQAHPLPPVTD